MFARDCWVAVSEELGGELEPADLVDRGGCGAAEPVRGDVGDARLFHDVSELSADVIRGVRGADARGEQQSFRVDEPDPS